MKFYHNDAQIFVPESNGLKKEEVFAKTTSICFSAHQDDIEIMAYKGILDCFGKPDKWFAGVVVTNGAGSPRDDVYANYTNEEMMAVRIVEQKKAAYVGEYSFQGLLEFTSSEVKDGASDLVINDIYALLMEAKPEVVYTHNLADKHDTHVSTALRVIAAIRKMPKEDRPKLVYGCEVWRGLDWMNDNDKVVLDVDSHENLANAVLGVFDSQICGGKRYDLATTGRRRANATYHASHGTDSSGAINFAMDLTPLIQDDSICPCDYVSGYIARFTEEITSRVSKFATK